jgi:hypothetical protein
MQTYLLSAAPGLQRKASRLHPLFDFFTKPFVVRSIFPPHVVARVLALCAWPNAEMLDSGPVRAGDGGGVEPSAFAARRVPSPYDILFILLVVV